MSQKTKVALVKVNLNSPQSLANFAVTLKDFIVTQNLFTEIAKKNYVNVEGWQFAGASLGIFPVVESVERMETTDGKEIKYMAKVKLIKVPGDKVVGSAMAICSSKENKRQNDDEYVIASMAQTRAIGKAYRNMLAWIMKLAGYEPTPTEEAMDITVDNNPDPVPEQAPMTDVKAKVNAAMMTMSTTDKMKFLKTVNKLNEKNLTDGQYRTLYWELESREKDATINT